MLYSDRFLADWIREAREPSPPDRPHLGRALPSQSADEPLPGRRPPGAGRSRPGPPQARARAGPILGPDPPEPLAVWRLASPRLGRPRRPPIDREPRRGPHAL